MYFVVFPITFAVPNFFIHVKRPIQSVKTNLLNIVKSNERKIHHLPHLDLLALCRDPVRIAETSLTDQNIKCPQKLKPFIR